MNSVKKHKSKGLGRRASLFYALVIVLIAAISIYANETGSSWSLEDEITAVQESTIK